MTIEDFQEAPRGRILFTVSKLRSKHLNAPLVQERADFMSHLLSQGMPRERIRGIGSMLINVIEVLNMKQLRMIDMNELQSSGHIWVTVVRKRRRNDSEVVSSYCFVYIAALWLKFSGHLRIPEAPKIPFDDLAKSYLDEMRFKGLTKTTISTRRQQLGDFQKWLATQVSTFAEVSLNHMDQYLNSCRGNGYSLVNLHATFSTLRLFLRFCESRSWCEAGIARGMLIPRRINAETGPRGPIWKDVKRMLSVVATSGMELRTNVVVSLCAVYALRSVEITRLRLTDFDWYNEIMTVQHAKGGGVQQFPIQHKVGEAILAYLKSARPQSRCPNLLTTFNLPIRPMSPYSVQRGVADRMRSMGIQSKTFGSHSLRHSCATRLLESGFPLNEIADFLGHHGLRSVAIYAKYNPKLLRSVASFSLAEIA